MISGARLFFAVTCLASLPLAGCSSGEPAECSCPPGQTCATGTCTPTQPAAGAGGSGSGIAGQGAGGSGQSGGAPGGSGGALPNGGSSGSLSGGSSSGGVAGSAPQGGASGGVSTGGTAGGAQGGMAGAPMPPEPDKPGQCKDDYLPAANNGSVTRYDFRQGTSLPACAYVITHTGSGSDGDWDTVEGISTGDGGYFGAMNTTDYAQGATCGACVEASYNGRKVVLTIVDECPVGSNPKCQKGHIDLSRKAIRQLEPNGSQEDLHNVSWHYVKCPASGNAKARLHPKQNPDWQPVIVENGLFPLKSVSLNGVAATRTGNNAGGNAWTAPMQKPPYKVRAEDVVGGVIHFDFTGGNNLADTGNQFKCQ